MDSNEIDRLNKTIKEKEREISDYQYKCRKQEKELRIIEKRQYKTSDEEGSKQRFMSIPMTLKVVVIILSTSFLAVIAFLSISFYVHRSTIDELKEEISLLKTEIKKEKKQKEGKKNAVQKNQNVISGIVQMDNGVTIVVKEFTNEKNYIQAGEFCHVSIVGKNAEQMSGGKWISKEFKVEGDVIFPKREFCGKIGKISYVVNDKTIASIDIPIKE